VVDKHTDMECEEVPALAQLAGVQAVWNTASGMHLIRPAHDAHIVLLGDHLISNLQVVAVRCAACTLHHIVAAYAWQYH
jgi:hypothetical protein